MQIVMKAGLLALIGRIMVLLEFEGVVSKVQWGVANIED
jgi:hypothetical protein